MATRDLSSTFLEFRANAKAKSVRRRHLSASASPMEGKALMRGEITPTSTTTTNASTDIRAWEAARSALPPIWVDSVADVQRMMTNIESKIESLSRLHTKRLMVRFDGTEFQEEQEINRVTANLTAEFRAAEKRLKSMMKNSGGDDDLDNSSSSVKVQVNVQRGLATKLQALSADFRKSQKDYLSRVKKQRTGPAEFDFLNNASSLPNDNDDDLFQSQMTEQHSDLINERDEEISKITSSIEELACIFKELAVLVIDQGTILDRIDYNMEQVVETTEKGLTQLETAEKSQKNSRGMKCIGILLSLITFMTLVLILKHIR